MTMEILKGVELKEYSTLRTGGKAEFFVRVKNVEEVLQALNFANDKSLPVLLLGEGSNVLISDRGFPGLVIKNELKGFYFEEGKDNVILHASSGEHWDFLVNEAVSRGFWGIENLSGIPGTAGASPVQNIGAYGSEVKDTIVSVEAYHTKTLERRVFSNEDCRFGYRDSFFKTEDGRKYFITEVVFNLSRQGKPNIAYKDLAKYFNGKDPAIKDVRKAVLKIRGEKFPDLRKVGTAGSFFKNPIISREKYEELVSRYENLPGFKTGEGIKLPLAWVLENILQKKGFREGEVALFEKQPLVLVNLGNATSEEIEMFAKKIIKEVLEKTGVVIEPEVNYF